jgi:RHS repeat-associated protein
LDHPFSMTRGGVTYYYLYDQLGSVIGLTNGAGTVVATYRYDPWGNLMSSTGSIENPFRFTGREWDAETGLYFYRTRYYDPEVGRFIQRDKIGLAGGWNFYTYAADNPLRWIDPDGLRFLSLTPSQRAAIDNLKKNTVIGPLVENLENSRDILITIREQGSLPEGGESTHVQHRQGALCTPLIRYNLRDAQNLLKKRFGLDTTLENVLAHELGHIHYGHFTPYSQQNPAANGAEAVRWENATRVPTAQRPPGHLG